MSSNDDSNCLDLVQTLHSGEGLRLAVKNVRTIAEAGSASETKDSPKLLTAISAILEAFTKEFGNTQEVLTLSSCTYLC
jgi:hypothetical protein